MSDTSSVSDSLENLQGGGKCDICWAKLPKGKQCIDLLYQVSFYTLSHPDHDFFIHQYIVDAYGAQHLTKDSKPIQFCSTLIGLYSFVEKGFTGKEAQNVHMALGSNMKIFPMLEIPKEKAVITVVDVLSVPDGDERDEMIKQWAKAVWELWKKDIVVVSSKFQEFQKMK